MSNRLRSTGREVEILSCERIAGKKCRITFTDNDGEGTTVCLVAMKVEWFPDRGDRVLLFGRSKQHFVEPVGWLQDENGQDTEKRCDDIVEKSKAFIERKTRLSQQIEQNENEPDNLRRLFVVETSIEAA